MECTLAVDIPCPTDLPRLPNVVETCRCTRESNQTINVPTWTFTIQSTVRFHRTYLFAQVGALLRIVVELLRHYSKNLGLLDDFRWLLKAIDVTESDEEPDEPDLCDQPNGRGGGRP